MSGDALSGPDNVLAGISDAVTGNFTAAGDRLAAATADLAGSPEPVPQIAGKPATVTAAVNLSDSAATYDGAESDSTQAVHGVAGALGGG